jgi:hypothetical protein
MAGPSPAEARLAGPALKGFGPRRRDKPGHDKEGIEPYTNNLIRVVLTSRVKLCSTSNGFAITKTSSSKG